jgi:hypothetical protein
MTLELVTMFAFRWEIMALTATTWALTFLLAVPIHSKLSRLPLAGQSQDTALRTSLISRLVTINWLRTLAWTLKSLLFLTW